MTACKKDKDELMRELMAADFAAYELQLFLNTHPNDTRALMMFATACQKSAMLRSEYECMYGPVTPCGAAGRMPWQWIKSPWNWE